MKAARGWFSRILLGVNIALFLAMFWLFVGRGATFASPWDGPAVVTIALAAVTVVLGAVTLGVALVAVWGYNALREHAGNIANKAASAAADAAVQRMMKDWGIGQGIADSGDAIATTYSSERDQ